MINVEYIQEGDFFTNTAHTWAGEVVEIDRLSGRCRVKLGSLKDGTGAWIEQEDLARIRIDKNVLKESPGFESVDGTINGKNLWKVRTEGDGPDWYLVGDGSLGTYTDGNFVCLTRVEYIDDLQHILRGGGKEMAGDIPQKNEPEGFAFVTPLSGDQLKACVDYLRQNRRVWNASDFARVIGAQASFISEICSGKRPFPEKLAEKICKAFPEVILR